MVFKVLSKCIFGQVYFWASVFLGKENVYKCQKRGLPNAHILFWLEKKIRPIGLIFFFLSYFIDYNQIDEIICAEIPNKDIDSILYEIVTKQMVHGPCVILNPNSPYMKNGKCIKLFPKQFLNYTHTGQDGYPKCRRRSNRWIVPYCPLL